MSLGGRGLERALDDLDEAAAASDVAVAARDKAAGAAVYAATPRDVRRSLQHSRRASAWRNLNTVERDVLLVMTALCKVGLTFSSCRQSTLQLYDLWCIT